MNHTGVVAGTCANCHNGSTAKGKPGNHVPTTVSCDVCHVGTTDFGNTKKPNHSLLTGTCKSCHGANYSGVVSKSVTHKKSTAIDCNDSGCHNTTTFDK